MKALILLFLFATVMVSDSAVDLSQEVKPQGTPLPIVQLGPKRSGPRTSYAVVSGFSDRRRMVIRDRDTLADVWKQIYSGSRSFTRSPGGEMVPNLPPPAPQIDFSRKMLLVVTMGSEPTSGYAIVVDGVYEQGDQLEVVVHNVSPGRGCVTLQYMTQPADIVEVEKREGSVVFRDVDIVTDCSQMRRAP
jgi:hypothetical protein